MKGTKIFEQAGEDWMVVVRRHNLYGKPYFSVVALHGLEPATDAANDIHRVFEIAGSLDEASALKMAEDLLNGCVGDWAYDPEQCCIPESEYSYICATFCSKCYLPLWEFQQNGKHGCQCAYLCPCCDEVL